MSAISTSLNISDSIENISFHYNYLQLLNINARKCMVRSHWYTVSLIEKKTHYRELLSKESRNNRKCASSRTIESAFDQVLQSRVRRITSLWIDFWSIEMPLQITRRYLSILAAPYSVFSNIYTDLHRELKLWNEATYIIDINLTDVCAFLLTQKDKNGIFQLALGRCSAKHIHITFLLICVMIESATANIMRLLCICWCERFLIWIKKEEGRNIWL